MPRNGSGTYSLPQAPFVPGTVISSAAVNSDLNDIASALTGSLPRDGQAGMTGQLKLADGTTAVPGWAFTNEVGTGFSRPSTGTLSVDIQGVQVATITTAGWIGPVQGGNPIGMVADFAGTAAPVQWILCFGQAVSRTTFALLFGVIGTTYGPGDGSTTFNLPDLRGRAVYGVDNMGGSTAGRITATVNFNGTVLGASGGLQNHTLTVAEIPTGITSSAVNSISVTPTGGLNGVPVTTGPANVTTSLVGGAAAVSVPGSTSGSWGGTGIFSGNNNINVTTNNTSGTTFSILSPAFMLNKIIYAGA